ncbi:MAG: hypothetical protein ACJAV5_001073 [Vicingaceae bacterium]|jgi:hypothetical protein
MKNTTILILLILSIIGCKKETNEINEAVDNEINQGVDSVNQIVDSLPPSKEVDSVLFSDIIPDTNLISIDSIVIVSNGPDCVDSRIPYPSQNTVTYEIDIDDDNVVDFNVSVLHSPTTCDYPKCGGWDDYSCVFKIEGNNSDDSIIVSKEGWGYHHILFKMNDTIQFNTNNGVAVWSTLINGCPHTGSENLRDSYLGVKKNGSIGWIHLDITTYGVAILDYAVNLTKGNSIIIKEQ